MTSDPPTMNPLRPISLTQPRTFAFGPGCSAQCPTDLLSRNFSRIFILASRSTAPLAAPIAAALRAAHATVAIYDTIPPEPTIDHFTQTLSAARDFHPHAVLGLGGGSPMDVAKLVAALHNSPQPLQETFGINKLSSRSTFLACLPTTAGTGSEVSPNAILLDESDHLKKAVISPHLVPDAAYVDPQLTLTVPPHITASTGLDALTHCIEAYANQLAHPLIDLYALQGARLIAQNLLRAVQHGDNLEARTNVLLGATYGGLCLGPVNTAAVHALSYPLGGAFHIPHGVANALLLPHVLQFNLPAAPERYAELARAMGTPGSAASATSHKPDRASPVILSEKNREQQEQRNAKDPAPSAAPRQMDEAHVCVDLIRALISLCPIPQRLRDLNIPESAIQQLAASALTVTRLLDRNVRPVTLSDAIEIYRSAY